jgi:hypothetical protein
MPLHLYLGLLFRLWYASPDLAAGPGSSEGLAASAIMFLHTLSKSSSVHMLTPSQRTSKQLGKY